MPVLMSMAISSLVSVVSSGMFKKAASSLGSASGGTLSAKVKKKISTFCGYAQVGMDPPSLEEYALKKPYQILSSYPNNRYQLFESIFLGE